MDGPVVRVPEALDEGDLAALRNDFPAVIVAFGREYATVDHAFWALSAADERDHDRIANAADAAGARRLAASAASRDGWTAARLGVMAALLRAKFTQHAGLGARLAGTGDAPVAYADGDRYWGGDGTNWIGRLLEIVRSELVLSRSGL